MEIQPKTWYSYYKEDAMAKRDKSKIRKVGLDAKGRVDYDLRENHLCLELARFGFYARTIARKTGLSENQIRYRLKQQAIYINDYRDGKSETATVIFRKFKVEDRLQGKL